MNDVNASQHKKNAKKERLHDVLISLLLAAIWLLGVTLVVRSGTEIPSSMLVVGTLFFLMLVPAMKELVKVLDRWLRTELGIADPGDEQQAGE